MYLSTSNSVSTLPQSINKATNVVSEDDVEIAVLS